MRDIMVLSGVWYSGALQAEAPVPTLPPTLLLMKVGYSILMGLSYGITKWIYSFIHSG